jgi:hypothetical protein
VRSWPEAHARTNFKGRSIGQPWRAALINGQKFCRRAEAAFVLSLVNPDTLADAALVDVFADGLDDARAIAIRDDAAKVEQVETRQLFS